MAEYWAEFFTGPQSIVIALLTSLLGAVSFIYVRTVRSRRRSLKTILKILFREKYWLSQSSLMDFKYLLAAKFVFAIGVAYATLTGNQISGLVYAGLTQAYGISDVQPRYMMLACLISTVLLYLAYEFAFWLDHILAHKVPLLWEFHKTHHSATVLTPFTNWRMHPIDTIVFANIVAVLVGTLHGVVHYTLGHEVAVIAVTGTNVLIFLYMAVFGHLQHSRLWIPLGGMAGRIILSPAHHQIHHSNNPIHFDKNFGAALCVFDWLFGTLHLPTDADRKLKLGVDDSPEQTRLLGSFFYPFVRGWRQLTRARVSA